MERNSTAVTSWARGTGDLVYNGSTDGYEDTGLAENNSYYYQAWSYTNWTYNPTLEQWSEGNASAGNWTDLTKPTIEFIPPTPSNGSTTDTYVHVNISSSDANQHYVFNNWNNSLVGWWRMDDASSSGEGADISLIDRVES